MADNPELDGITHKPHSRQIWHKLSNETNAFLEKKYNCPRERIRKSMRTKEDITEWERESKIIAKALGSKTDIILIWTVKI